MAARDLTVKVPEELVEKANVYAAEHETTVDELVCTLLQQTLGKDDRGRAQAAAEWLIEMAKRGPYFTDDPGSISRDELHERR